MWATAFVTSVAILLSSGEQSNTTNETIVPTDGGSLLDNNTTSMSISSTDTSLQVQTTPVIGGMIMSLLPNYCGLLSCFVREYDSSDDPEFKPSFETCEAPSYIQGYVNDTARFLYEPMTRVNKELACGSGRCGGQNMSIYLYWKNLMKYKWESFTHPDEPNIKIKFGYVGFHTATLFFYIYLFLFPLPVFIFQSINILILKKLLKNESTAFIFHALEILADIIGFTMIGLLLLDVPSTFCPGITMDRRMHVASYTNFRDAIFLWSQLLSFLLVLDRWLALFAPMRYSSQFGRSRTFAIVLCMLALCFSILVSMIRTLVYRHLFYSPYWALTPSYYTVPDSFRWVFSDANWRTPPITKFQSTFSIFYFVLVFSIFVGQCVFSGHLLFMFRKQQKGSAQLSGNKDEALKAKEQMSMKFNLLIGTSFLNMVCILPYLIQFCMEYANQQFACIYTDVEDWWRCDGDTAIVFGVGLFLQAIQASVGILFHIAFTKTYREAFLNIFGKAIPKAFRSASSTSSVTSSSTKITKAPNSVQVHPA